MKTEPYTVTGQIFFGLPDQLDEVEVWIFDGEWSLAMVRHEKPDWNSSDYNWQTTAATASTISFATITTT
jgi:hypothetical protein